MVTKQVINYFVVFILIIYICSCSENKKVNKFEQDIVEINFSDQVEFQLEDKYFSLNIDSIEYYPFINYRIDINSNQLYRYWVRKYNNIFEIRFFNREAFEKTESEDSIFGKKGYNYLFGIRNNKAFFIKWRNVYPSSKEATHSIRITSDISKYTQVLQTNLPLTIIKKYFPVVKCPIKVINQVNSKIKIKFVDAGKIISSNYRPF